MFIIDIYKKKIWSLMCLYGVFFLEGNSIILFSDNLKLIMVEEFII